MQCESKTYCVKEWREIVNTQLFRDALRSIVRFFSYPVSLLNRLAG